MLVVDRNRCEATYLTYSHVIAQLNQKAHAGASYTHAQSQNTVLMVEVEQILLNLFSELQWKYFPPFPY